VLPLRRAVEQFVIALDLAAGQALLPHELLRRRGAEHRPGKARAADDGAPVALSRKITGVDRRHAAGVVGPGLDIAPRDKGRICQALALRPGEIGSEDDPLALFASNAICGTRQSGSWAMPQIVIRIEDDVPGARARLRLEVERLEVAGKPISNILYPPSLATCLGVAEVGARAQYDGHPASPRNVVPYEIIIEHEG